MPGARTAFYLFNFRNKEGMREFHTCPFSAKHCTSVYLASIHSLSTSLPGSSAPIRPPVFLPCAPGGEELLPKCLRHSWGSSRLTSAPRREWSCSGWRRAVDMCPSAPACPWRAECSQPPSLTPHFWRCISAFASPSRWTGHPLPAQVEGFVFQTALAFLIVLERAITQGKGGGPGLSCRSTLSWGFLHLFDKPLLNTSWAVRRLQSQPSSAVRSWAEAQAESFCLLVLPHGNEGSDLERDVGLLFLWAVAAPKQAAHQIFVILLCVSVIRVCAVW